MLIDLHTHTFPSSDDSFMSPDEMVEQAKGRRLDGICVTEHDYFWDPAALLDLSRRHDFLVLPGCEVNTDGGHVLVFGLVKYVFGMHKIERLRELVDDSGGVMIAAHPYRRRYQRDRAGDPDAYRSMVEEAYADRFFSFCDGIEALNGRATDKENSFSVDLGGLLGLRMAGASDSHRPNHMGTAATRFYDKITCLDDLIGAVKAGRFEPAVLPNGSQDSALASDQPERADG